MMTLRNNARLLKTLWMVNVDKKVNKIKDDQLTAKQVKFAELVASGSTQADAYRGSYDTSKMKPNTVIEKASMLMAENKVRTRVALQKEKLAEKELWTREDSVKALKGIIENPDNQSVLTNAVKELNNMHGFNAPKKVELSGGIAIAKIERIIITREN